MKSKNALTKLSDGWCSISTTGLKPFKVPTYKQWDLEVEKWAAINKVSPVIIGDLLAYGCDVFGEKFAQATRHFEEYEYPTLANYKYICSSVNGSIRKSTQNFNHLKAVASLSPGQQAQALDTAERYDLSGSSLSRELKQKTDKGFVDYAMAAQMDLEKCLAAATDAQQVKDIKAALRLINGAIKNWRNGGSK